MRTLLSLSLCSLVLNACASEAGSGSPTRPDPYPGEELDVILPPTDSIGEPDSGGRADTGPSPDSQGSDSDGGADIEADAWAPDESAGPSDNPFFEGSWSFEVIDTFSHTFLGVSPVTYEVVQGTFSNGNRTWMLVSVPREVPAAALITNEPYAGITFTNQDIDARWAEGGNGFKPDLDAPHYNGSDIISYERMTRTQAAEADLAALLNGIDTIRVFGRFYAGESLANDILDASAAYAYIAAHPNRYNPNRVGALGFSWGGMMALFGSTLAPEGVKPKVLAALAPPSDFADLARWSHTDLPALYPRPAEVTAFFSPYWRRASEHFGLPPEPSRIADSHLTLPCAALPDAVFMVHDDWDSLIPVRQTEALDRDCPQVSALYWRRAPQAFSTLDHGPISHGTYISAAQTFVATHLISALASPAAETLYSIGHTQDLKVYFTLVREAHARGQDSGSLSERLYELTDPRLLLHTTEGFEPGPTLTANALNAAWGTTYTGESLRAALVAGTFTLP